MKRITASILLSALLLGILLFLCRSHPSPLGAPAAPSAASPDAASRTLPGYRAPLAADAPSESRRRFAALPFALPSFIALPDATLLSKLQARGGRWRRLDDAARNPVVPEFQEPVTTNEIILILAPGAQPQDVARDHRLESRQAMAADLNAWVFRAASPKAAVEAREIAAADPRVRGAFLNRIEHRVKGFVANDPMVPAGGGFPGQWHHTDANTVGAWAIDATGAGVFIGIVDDGLQTAHPDLSPNYDAANSLNVGPSVYTGDPNPNFSRDGTSDEDRHGTSVSGVAAARGGNGIGGSGAAPLASVSCQRIDFLSLTTQKLSDAVGYHCTGGNTVIKVKNHSYGSGQTFIESLMEATTVTSSVGNGTLHCYSAGNGYPGPLQDSNKLMPQNSPDVITVAAIGSDGFYADYSSFGANVFICAPSSSATGFGIMTTDRVGSPGYNPDQDTLPDQDYTSVFGGTSSASPLAAGIMALGKQALPALSVRLAQHVLVRSCDLVDPSDGSQSGGGDGVTAGSAWKQNAAGRSFNQNYGFGRINALNFIKEAVRYSGVTALQTETATGNVATAIPDNSGTGLTQTFSLASTTPLESIVVSLNISHPRRGDLVVELTSPSGTLARLVSGHSSDTRPLPEPTWSGSGMTAWPLVTHAFWGENPLGTWTLHVMDLRTGPASPPAGASTWNSYSVTARMGTPILDVTNPTVLSINRAAANPTVATSLPFTVKFSEFVTGVDASDFVLTTTGGSTATITGVTGGIDTYTVTVDPGVNGGTIRLDLVDNGSIVDGNGNPLGGPGPANGNFTGQAYQYLGSVDDGFSGADIDTQTSTSTIEAHWETFVGGGAAVGEYRWCIGTTMGGAEVLASTSTGLVPRGSTSAANLDLALSVGTTYYVTVECTDGLGGVTRVSSDGVQVLAGGGVIPDKPARLDTLNQPTAVQLIWKPSPTPGVATYKLWHKLAAQPWTAATRVVGLTGTTATVTGFVKGQTYDFQLRAVMADGTESLGIFATGTPADLFTVNGASYGTIQLAIDNATAGQTVLIQGGTYSVSLNLKGGITLSGVSPQFTILSASSAGVNVINGATTPSPASSTVSNLTITGGQVGVSAGAAPIVLRNVVIHHTASHGASSTASLQVVNCTIAHNGGDGVNTSGTTLVRSSIVTGNAGDGIDAPAGASITYTDSYANTASQFPAGPDLSTTYSTTVLFTDEPGNDYTDTPASFVVDRGDPGDPFVNEPDYNGSRVNLGAFGNTSFAATSPGSAPTGGGGGGGGGGCGLTGLEVLLVLTLRRRRIVPG